MDYTKLTASKGTAGSIANWVNYSDVLLPLSDILTEAQALIYKSLRVREMIVSDYVVALAQGAINAPLPAGFLDPINVRDLYNTRMHAKDLSTIKNRRALDGSGNWVQGLPAAFAVGAGTIEFDCAPDASAAGSYRMDYFGALAPLSAQAPTNFLTDRYPTLLRYACQAMAADFLDNKTRRDDWMARTAGEIVEIGANDDLALRGAQIDPDYSEAW